MPLTKSYPPAFERIWAAYPKWPKGRSVKTDAFKAFESVQKDLGGFTSEDIDTIVAAIEKQKVERASWQPKHPHGPQGLQRWLRVHGWHAEYDTVKDTGKRQGRQSGWSGHQPTDEENAIRFVQDQMRRGLPVPPKLMKYEAAARQGMAH